MLISNHMLLVRIIVIIIIPTWKSQLYGGLKPQDSFGKKR